MSRINCVVPWAKASVLLLRLGTIAMFEVIALSMAVNADPPGDLAIRPQRQTAGIRRVPRSR